MTTSLQLLSERLAASYPTSGVNFHLALILDNRSSFVFTANSATDVLTTTSNHDFIANLPVMFAGVDLPAPLNATTTYYVGDVTTNTFKISATAGGTAINLTTAGSGILTVSDKALDEGVSDLTQWIRKEISSYQGIANRQAFTPVAPAINYTDKSVKIEATVPFNNTSGTQGLVFDKAVLIRAGTATRGNTTGTFDSYWNYAGSQTIAAAENRSIKISLEVKNG